MKYFSFENAKFEPNIYLEFHLIKNEVPDPLKLVVEKNQPFHDQNICSHQNGFFCNRKSNY